MFTISMVCCRVSQPLSKTYRQRFSNQPEHRICNRQQWGYLLLLLSNEILIEKIEANVLSTKLNTNIFTVIWSMHQFHLKTAIWQLCDSYTHKYDNILHSYTKSDIHIQPLFSLISCQTEHFVNIIYISKPSVHALTLRTFFTTST